MSDLVGRAIQKKFVGKSNDGKGKKKKQDDDDRDETGDTARNRGIAEKTANANS